MKALEHFQKYCSHSGSKKDEAVLLGFGFVSTQSQGLFEPAPSPKPRQNPKILAPNGYRIFSNALCATIVLAAALSSSIALAVPPPPVAGPAVVDIHGTAQALNMHEISYRTNIVRGTTNFTQVNMSTTTNFTMDAASLMAMLENSFNTNFPPGSQLLLSYGGSAFYSLIVSDSTGTNLGFNPRQVLRSSDLSGPASIVASGTRTLTTTNQMPSIFFGTDKETYTAALSFTYDDTAMTNTHDGTSTRFTWVGLVHSKSSVNLTNSFYDQTVSMEIIGGGGIRIPTNQLDPFGEFRTVFTGSIKAKVSGLGD